MRLRYMLPSLVVLLAVGIGIADDITESAENPFGRYTLEGRERWHRDPFIAKAILVLEEEDGELHLTYTNPKLLPWNITLKFEAPLDGVVLEELERGQGIRRRFVLEGERYGDEVRGEGLLHMRKNNDGEFRLAVQYAGDVIVRTQEEEEDEDAEGDGDDDDDADDEDDDEDEDEEDEEPREIIIVIAHFTGNVSGTQGDDEEDED